MAIDVSGFVTPPQDFGGIYKVSNDLRENDAIKRRERQIADAKKANATKYLTDYLDDKDKYTGTNYDPIRHALISSSLDNALAMVSEGRDINEIMMSISKPVAQAGEYTLRAQKINDNLKNATELLKGKKGIDINKFQEAFMRKAWEGKNIDDVDPSANYADAVLREDDVFNTEGFDESFSKAPKNTEDATMINTNSRGGREKTKVKLTAPYYAVSEKDGEGNHIGFVPKYQVATDAGNEIIHEFKTDQGDVKAPIRLYDKDLFDAMQPEEKAYVLQEVRKFAKEKEVDLSAPQMENFARAVAYDLKKSRINGTYVHAEETKANPAPRITVNVGGGRGSEEVINDIYQSIEDQVKYDIEKVGAKSGGSKVATRINSLNTDGAALVVKTAKELGYDNATASNLFLIERSDGRIIIYLSVALP